MPEPKSLFESDGQFMHPTAAALGPWRANALHGGAVSTLLGHSLEEEDWLLGRMSLDLMRRVPPEPLRLVLGPSISTRRLLRKSIELWCGDRLVAKAEGLLLPRAHLDLPSSAERKLDVPPDLEDETDRHRVAIAERVGYPSFVSHAVSTRKKRLQGRHAGAFVYWLKLLVPVVEGGEITPIQRVCAAADYANGGFTALPFEEWSFMSLDLTVQLVRPPVGDWIAVTNDSLAETTGIGLGDAELYDRDGRIGRSTSTLLVERR
jgi:Thioesterase-like superfamily